MPTSDSATQNPATTPTIPTLDPDFTPVEISDAPGSTTDLATLIDRVNALQEQVAAMTPEVITARDSLSRMVGCIKKTDDYVDIGYIGYNASQGRMALFDPSGNYIAAFLTVS